MRTIKCKDCGVEIVKDHNSRILCKDCATKRRREICSKSQKEWYKHHKKEHLVNNKRYYDKNRDIIKRRTKAWLLNIRKEVLNFYGNKCQCCGENRIEFLSIDHINGGGTKHRKEISHANIYVWLKRNKFPEGFQILCHNCNMSKAYYGYCPHRV